jgi:branched-chain amino acid transport system permease protein
MLAFTLSSVLPLWAAILAAIVLTALIGSLLDFVFIRTLNKIDLRKLNILLFGFIVFVCALLLIQPGKSPVPFLAVAAVASAVLLPALNLIWRRWPSCRKFFNKKSKPDVLQMIIVTIGLSIILREIALKAWGEQVRTLPFFSGTETSSIALFGAQFSPQILWVLGITGLIVIALSLFFKYTLTGQAMRSCGDTTDGASLCGINPQVIVNLSFMLSAGIGALAGCVIAPRRRSSIRWGVSWRSRGFTVAIFGGLGNSMGALAAGLYPRDSGGLRHPNFPRGLQRHYHDRHFVTGALSQAGRAFRRKKIPQRKGIVI